MNKFYNNEDDSLRHKLVEHEFEALPQAWEQMSALLDSQPIVAKRFTGYYWWGLSLTALLIGAASGVYYYNAKKAPTTVATPAITNPAPMALKSAPVQIDWQSTAKEETGTASQKATHATTATSSEQTSKETAPTAAMPLPLVLEDAESASNIPNEAIEKESTTTTNTTIAAPAEETPLVNTLNNRPRTAITTPKVLSEDQQRRIKKTRTEYIYQYSTTPLRTLQDRRQQQLGTFGVKEVVDFKKSPIKFGVTVGASAQLPAISNTTVGIRPVLGVQASSALAKHHRLQIGAQYKNLAVDTKPNPKNTTSSAVALQTISGLHLVEMPVVYQLQPHPKYNFQTGVKPAIVLGASSENDKALNLKELGVSGFDIGVLFGAGYNFNEHWSIGVQYTLGLLNLAEHADQASNAAADLYDLSGVSQERELIVPNTTTEYTRVPQQIRNSDLQLLLKYNF